MSAEGGRRGGICDGDEENDAGDSAANSQCKPSAILDLINLHHV